MFYSIPYNLVSKFISLILPFMGILPSKPVNTFSIINIVSNPDVIALVNPIPAIKLYADIKNIPFSQAIQDVFKTFGIQAKYKAIFPTNFYLYFTVKDVYTVSNLMKNKKLLEKLDDIPYAIVLTYSLPEGSNKLKKQLLNLLKSKAVTKAQVLKPISYKGHKIYIFVSIPKHKDQKIVLVFAPTLNFILAFPAGNVSKQLAYFKNKLPTLTATFPSLLNRIYNPSTIFGIAIKNVQKILSSANNMDIKNEKLKRLVQSFKTLDFKIYYPDLSNFFVIEMTVDTPMANKAFMMATNALRGLIALISMSSDKNLKITSTSATSWDILYKSSKRTLKASFNISSNKAVLKGDISKKPFKVSFFSSDKAVTLKIALSLPLIKDLAPDVAASITALIMMEAMSKTK